MNYEMGPPNELLNDESDNLLDNVRTFRNGVALRICDDLSWTRKDGEACHRPELWSGRRLSRIIQSNIEVAALLESLRNDKWENHKKLSALKAKLSKIFLEFSKGEINTVPQSAIDFFKENENYNGIYIAGNSITYTKELVQRLLAEEQSETERQINNRVLMSLNININVIAEWCMMSYSFNRDMWVWHEPPRPLDISSFQPCEPPEKKSKKKSQQTTQKLPQKLSARDKLLRKMLATAKKEGRVDEEVLLISGLLK
jgi:hypothetical protein